MTSVVVKTQCLTCESKVVYKCEGCQQTLISYQQHPLNTRIDQWEQESICLIQQTANDARNTLRKHVHECIPNIDIQLNKLTENINEIKNKDYFVESHLNDLKIKFEELQKQFNQLNNVEIKEDSTLIKRLLISTKRSNLSVNTKWNPNAVTIAGGKGSGEGLDQFNYPYGICIDDERTIYIADQYNNRVVEWKKDAKQGRIIAGVNGEGNQNNQLNSPIILIIDYQNDALIISDYGNKRVMRWPRQNGQHGEVIISNVVCYGMAMDKNGYLYVVNIKEDEVRRWKIGEKQGTLVAGGKGKGDRYDQLNSPANVFVDENESVYVSDSENHRVMKWVKDAREGIIVAGGQGQGNGLSQLSKPHGLFVDQSETVYVADWQNNRVVRWLKGSQEGELVVGENNQGNQPNQLFKPTAFSFDRDNNLYVVDEHNNRIQKFSIANHFD